MPPLNDFLVRVATDANLAKRFRKNPSDVVSGANLSSIEEAVLLSRNPTMIQSTLQAAALTDSLKAAADTTYTVIIVL